MTKQQKELYEELDRKRTERYNHFMQNDYKQLIQDYNQRIQNNEKNAIQLIRSAVNKKEETPKGSEFYKSCSNLEEASDIFVYELYEFLGIEFEKVLDRPRQKQGIDFILDTNLKIDCKFQSPDLRSRWDSNLKIKVNAESKQSKENIGWVLDPTHTTDAVLYICPDFNCPQDQMIIDFVLVNFVHLQNFVKKLEATNGKSNLKCRKLPVYKSDAENWIIPISELKFHNWSINYRIQNGKLIATQNIKRTMEIVNAN